MRARRPSRAAAFSEGMLCSNVIALAKFLGYYAVHFRPAVMRSGHWATNFSGDAGFPDLVLAGRGRVLFVELKSDIGRLTPGQEQWLARLQVPGVTVTVWSPRDWHSGLIERILQDKPHAPSCDLDGDCACPEGKDHA